MTIYRSLIFCTALALILVLPGCFIPEKFDASLHIFKDGSYTFKYNGTMAYAPALQKAHQNKLTPQDEQNLKDLVKKGKWPQGFKEFTYQDNGRYKLVVEKQGKPLEDYAFIDKDIPLFKITHGANGTVNVIKQTYKKNEKYSITL